MKAKKLNLHCYFCGGVLKANNAYFEIYDQEMPPYRKEREDYVRFNEHGGRELYGSLTYPGNGNRFVQEGKWGDYKRVVLFTHAECGPDVGYHFSFDRLNENWERHLQGKVWHDYVIDEALITARSAMGVK